MARTYRFHCVFGVIVVCFLSQKQSLELWIIVRDLLGRTVMLHARTVHWFTDVPIGVSKYNKLKILCQPTSVKEDYVAIQFHPSDPQANTLDYSFRELVVCIFKGNWTCSFVSPDCNVF